MSHRLQDSINAWQQSESDAANLAEAAKQAAAQAQAAATAAVAAKTLVSAELGSFGGIAVKIIDDTTALLFQTDATPAGFHYVQVPLTSKEVTDSQPDPAPAPVPDPAPDPTPTTG